jgi:hypothetical protein
LSGEFRPIVPRFMSALGHQPTFQARQRMSASRHEPTSGRRVLPLV